MTNAVATPKSVKSKDKPKRTAASKRLQNSPVVTYGHGTHARAKGLDALADRVGYLLELMLDAAFHWKTTDELAAVWGCDPATVRAYAAEARRHYIREIDRSGRDDYRARLMSRIEFVGRDALERTEEVIDGMGDKHTIRKPDHRTALRALTDLAQLGGLLVHKHEVTVSELTEEEIRAQLRAHGLEVKTILETTAEPALGQGETHDGSDDGGAGGA